MTVAEYFRVNAPAEWGIEPVPESERNLRSFDLFVLWLSLGVGLLVIQAGTYLAPLGVANAVAAVVIGSVFGVLLLALAGRIGSQEGVPSMVLLRPLLGVRGSFAPSMLNVLQLVGWTAFELWIMGYAASEISARYFGFRGPVLWTLVFAAFATLLALGGPTAVVRQWLEKFGVWAMLAASVWLTYRLATLVDFSELLSAQGDGATFWLMVDLVIAMPVSWLPLVSDYNRFARSPQSSLSGTFAGYLVANTWFYLLGVLFILAVPVGESTAQDVVVAILAVAGGALALIMILVDEADNAFADIYSASVSIQNVLPKISRRWVAVGVAAVSTALAVSVTMTDYFDFLLLIGSVFVPLFALLLADYYLIRRGRGYDTEALYEAGGQYWYGAGFNWPAIVTWIIGIAVFHLLADPATTGISPIGSSLPAFAVTFVLYLVLYRIGLVAVGRVAVGRGADAEG
jgi:putative hydroxymethylpyrimidine transporter CytX